MGDDDDDQPLPGEHDSRRARLLLPQRGAAALDPPLILHREHAERNFNWCAAGITWVDNDRRQPDWLRSGFAWHAQ
jgi:hypothetical protein